MTDAVSVNHRDRVFEIKSVGLSEDAVQKRKHFVVRIRSASEENDARTVPIGEQHEPRIVEISGDDNPAVPPAVSMISWSVASASPTEDA
jgi:hypothetical protein